MKVFLKQGERGKRKRRNFPCLSATKTVHLEGVPEAASGYLESQLTRNFYIWNLPKCLNATLNLSPENLEFHVGNCQRRPSAGHSYITPT